MRLQLSDIKNIYKNVTLTEIRSMQDYYNLLSREGTSINGTHDPNILNYTISEIHFLLRKSTLNLYTSEEIIRKGYFSWAFVTTYYSIFFLLQSLNRLQINFYSRNFRETYQVTYENSSINIKKKSLKEPHDKEFQMFNENYLTNIINLEGILNDKSHWREIVEKKTIILNCVNLRNKINYRIEKENFNDPNLTIEERNRIINDYFKNNNFSELNTLEIFNIAKKIYYMVWDILNEIAKISHSYRVGYLREIKYLKENIQQKYESKENLLKNIDNYKVFEGE